MSTPGGLRSQSISDILDQYKLIYHKLNIMVIVHDLEGNITEVNEKVLTTFGYSKEEILSITVKGLQTEHSQLACREIIERTLKDGRTSQETTLRKKNGEVFPVRVYTNLLDADNDPLILCVLDDISELKQVESRLRESNTFLDSIIENIPDMIFLKDAEELKFVRFNKAGEDLLGYSRDDLIGMNDYDFFPAEEADFFTSKDREVLSSGKILDIPEEQIHTKTKGVRTLHTKKITLNDEDYKPKYLLGISEDITDRKQLEEMFELVVESVPNAIIISNESGAIDLLNKQTEIMFGYERTELVGKPVEILIPEKYRSDQRENWAKLLSELKTSRMGAGRELSGLHKDGSEFPCPRKLPHRLRKFSKIICNVNSVPQYVDLSREVFAY